MKKNNMLFIMFGFSAALHGLVLFGAARNGFRIPPPVPEDRHISAIKIIKTNISSPKSVPNKPPEEKIVEKPIEPLPVSDPVQEETPIEPLPMSDALQETEYTENTLEENIEETQHSTEMADNGGTVAGNEQDELLAYIKNFINKNLAYPPMARRRNIQGVVRVSFTFEKNGELVSIEVSRSSGSSILDKAAVSLIKQIHPIESIPIKRKMDLTVNIDYKLTEQE
jgi:protein TonB